MLSMNHKGKHREEQALYKQGWDDEKSLLGDLLMSKGLKAAMRKAIKDIDLCQGDCGAYKIGVRHAAEEWLDETKGI